MVVVWFLTMGATYPDYFAALIPIAAPLTVDQSGIDKLKNQPMWLIHTKGRRNSTTRK